MPRFVPILLVIACAVTATPVAAVPNKPDRGPSPALRKPSTSLTGERVVFRDDTALRWRPGGPVVKRLPRRDKRRAVRGTVTGVVVLEMLDDIQVRVDTGPVRGLVWIERGDVLAGAVAQPSPSPPSPPPGPRVSTVTVDAGACLRDRPDGTVVAVVARTASFRDRPSPKGWRWIAVSIVGDEVEVAVRPGDAMHCLTAAEIAAQ